MKKLLFITLLFLYNTSYASCRPTIIILPDGSQVVCQVCKDGKIVICN